MIRISFLFVFYVKVAPYALSCSSCGRTRRASSSFIVIISTVLVFVHSVLKENGRDPYADVQRLPLVVRWALYYLVIFLTLISFICVTDTTGFLYANF